ncbi:hypothetical protein GW17_00004677 [Ensete ventricosum]|nr:hypothetical protein GW17_00004677 [Ensete ventricosum]
MILLIIMLLRSEIGLCVAKIGDRSASATEIRLLWSYIHPSSCLPSLLIPSRFPSKMTRLFPCLSDLLAVLPSTSPPLHLACYFNFSDISELNLPKSTVISFPNGKDDLMNFEISIRPDEGYYQ